MLTLWRQRSHRRRHARVHARVSCSAVALLLGEAVGMRHPVAAVLCCRSRGQRLAVRGWHVRRRRRVARNHAGRRLRGWRVSGCRLVRRRVAGPLVYSGGSGAARALRRRKVAAAAGGLAGVEQRAAAWRGGDPSLLQLETISSSPRVERQQRPASSALGAAQSPHSSPCRLCASSNWRRARLISAGRPAGSGA